MTDSTPATAAGPPRSPAEAAALGKRLADEGHAVGWPATAKHIHYEDDPDACTESCTV